MVSSSPKKFEITGLTEALVSNGRVAQLFSKWLGKLAFVTVLFFGVLLSPTTLLADNLSQGLVAYYPLNNSAEDASGNSNNGTMVSVSETADRAGIEGSAILFDSSSYITTKFTLLQTLRNEFTISVWLKLAESCERCRIVTKNTEYDEVAGQDRGAPEYQLYIEGQVPTVHLNWEQPGDEYASSVAVETNVWTHLLVRVRPNSVEFFLNGELVTSFNEEIKIPPVLDREPFVIGSGGSTGGSLPVYSFQGALDDLLIYNRALSDSEISAVSGGESVDADDDGVPDWLDAFPSDSSEQFDTDDDGAGNAADSDDDDDGVLDAEDPSPTMPHSSGVENLLSTVIDGNLRACLSESAEKGNYSGVGEFERIECSAPAGLSGREPLLKIEGISSLVNLRSVSISGFIVADFSGLAGLPVRDIWYYPMNYQGTGFTDHFNEAEQSKILDPVSSMLVLSETLEFLSTRIDNLAPLAGLPKIRRLGLTRFDDNWPQNFQGQFDLSDLNSISDEITHLYLDDFNLADIFFIERLTQLRELFIKDYRLERSRLTDISSLERLANPAGIEKLWFENQGVEDISPLAQMDGLIFLKLAGLQVSEFSPLTSLNTLSELQIDRNSPISDLSFLTGTALNRVEILDSGVTSVSSLPGSTSIESIDFWDNDIVRLEGIEGLEGLRNLRLGGNSLTNIDAVSALTNLEYLDINGAQAITSLTPLQSLSKLNNLIIDGTSVANLDPVADKPIFSLGAHRTSKLPQAEIVKVRSVNQLYVASNDYVSLDAFQSLPNLSELGIYYNKIRDISSIKDFPALQTLLIQGNRVSEVGDALSGINEGRVDLSDNPLLCSEYDSLLASKSESLEVIFNSTCVAVAADTDGDGVGDDVDDFPNDPAASVDTDSDGLPDEWNVGKSSVDSTSSPALELDNDDDNDGVPDSEDPYPLISSLEVEGTLLDPFSDTDNDGVNNVEDRFPHNPAEWIDLDFDGLGNNEDLDDDGDGTPDSEDTFPENAFEQLDSDGDGVGDFIDAEPNNANVQSLTIAQALEGITESILRNCLERQTQELTYASELESLSCGGDDGGPTTDLSGIRAFYNLQRIYLGRGAPSTLEPLRGLIYLRSLGIANYDWDFSDFGQLAPFYNLDEFYFDQVMNLTSEDLEPLERLPRLTHFSSGSRGTLTSLEFLSKLPRLQRLGVNYSGVLDYSPVNFPKYLRDFYAWANNPAITNVEFLEYAPNLRDLSLERNALSSLEGIQNAPNLKSFDARNSLLTDISPLAGLKELQNLSLSGNQIVDVSPLRDLTNVRLDLRFNSIVKVYGRLPTDSGSQIDLDDNPLSCGDVGSYIASLGPGVEVYPGKCVEDLTDLPICPPLEEDLLVTDECSYGSTVLIDVVSSKSSEWDMQGNTFRSRKGGRLSSIDILVRAQGFEAQQAESQLELRLFKVSNDEYEFENELAVTTLPINQVQTDEFIIGNYADYKSQFTRVDLEQFELDLVAGERYGFLLRLVGDIPATADFQLALSSNFIPGEVRISTKSTDYETTDQKPTLSYSPQKDVIFAVQVTGEDSDGDGILDSSDAFPNDPAASVDTDGDGKPDDWNVGYSAVDSTSSPQLTLDEDDDGDGVPDVGDYAPKNANIQYATLKQAYDGLANRSLQSCIQMQNPSLSQVTNLIEVNCQNQALYGEIDSLVGLAAFPNIERIYLSQIGNLKQLDELRGLSQLREFVYLESPNTVSTLEPLSGLQFLERFEIQESVIRSEGLANLDLPSLRRLRLGSDLRDLTFLSQFPRLEALLLNGNAISDFSAIKDLSELTELSFADNAIPLTDLSILNGSKLKFVALQQMGITSLESMPASGSIEFLSLQGNQITNLDGLQGLSGLLQTLEFLDNPVSNLSPIRNLRVQNLWLGRTNITDLEPISEMTELKAIHLDGLQVASLDPLVGLPNLVELNAEGPTAFDTAEVSKLTGLKRLRFKFQQLKSLDGLADLAELQFLDVASNALTDISALRGFSNLTWLSLESNQVSYLGNAFANMKQGPVRLSFNPILCSEIDALRAASGDQLDIVFETDCVESSDDADQDGVLDQVDDFPSDPAASKDSDGDGKPDDWNEGYSASDSTSSPTLSLDEDDDGDGVPDVEDAFPLDANRSFLDADNDDVADSLDNCPNKANNSQLDTDDDGQGDACDTDDDGDGVLDPDDAFPLDPKRSVAGKQKAIIIAGGGPYRGNYLWEATENMANLALTTLRAQGIKREDIYYLTAGFGDNADEGATLESIERVLLEWAVSDEAPADDLLIYLVDHGGPGVFEVDQTTELEAAQLDAWLDQIQTSISGTVSVVYDACQSGSFIPSLAASDGQSRLLIASAGADQPAIFAARGEISFSHNFWSNYLVGGNIYSAFNAGRDAMAFVLDKGQKAEIEANGDGIPNQKADRIAASSFQFGFGITLASDLPSIGRLEGEVVLSGEKTTQIRAVGVTGATRITGVSAIVTSPDQVVASADTPITQLRQIALQDENGDGTWEGEVTDLEVQGTYVVTFFATNEAGLKSIATAEKPNRIEIVQTQGRVPNVGKDTDGDGAFDLNDAFPLDPAYSDDEDGDFRPDELDQDVDGDGESAERDGPDIFENEVDRNGAAFLGFGSGREQLRNFHTAKDVDYAWFWVTQDASYRLTASIKGDQRATGSDLALTLMNSIGSSYQTVGKVDETLGGETESVEFLAEGTERVWVSLRDFNGLTGAKTAYAVSLKQIDTRGATDLYVKARPQSRYQSSNAPFVRRFEVGNAELGEDAERVVLVIAAQEGWSAQRLPSGCKTVGYDVVCELGAIASGARQVVAIPLAARNEGRADLNVFAYAVDVDGRSLPEFEMADNELTIAVMTSTDEDDDGLPDEYELRKGLNPSVNDAADDLDGDGISNLDEFLAGTDPATIDEDRDGDGVEDGLDAFPLDQDESVDTDGDGVGNNADTDDDGDGIADSDDSFALISLAGRTDTDGDGYPNDCDAACLETGMLADEDDDNDGVADIDDAFSLDKNESVDTDGDGVGDNSDSFPEDKDESVDSDGDEIGNNGDNCPLVANADQANNDLDAEGDACDTDDDNDGFSDEAELEDGTDPFNPFSCESGCFSFDIDDNTEAKALTDGLLVIRHLFGFGGESLISGAVADDAQRTQDEAISSYLSDASDELDIDLDGESKALTDGLLLIRYLFGFSGASLTSNAVSSDAERKTSEQIETYINDRMPPESP